MNKEAIRAAVVELLDGNDMSDSLFDLYLNSSQTFWENRRPWVVMRTEDATQTVSPSDTFETEKSLPANFRKWYTMYPIVLTDAAGNECARLKEIPIQSKNRFKDDPTKFYCNYRTKKLYICGRQPQGYTVRQYYIARGTKISANDENTWDLDPNDEYTQIHAFTIAAKFKHGVDYDVINNAQGDEHAKSAAEMYSTMTDWDNELQLEQLPLDYGEDGQSASFSETGGRLSGLI
jgi:hypothetical protein